MHNILCMLKLLMQMQYAELKKQIVYDYMNTLSFSVNHVNQCTYVL